MLRLDLSNTPHWLELMPDLRVQLAPLTTALMVAARNDEVVTTLSVEASDEERALVFAKAIARMAILDWEGVGDVDGHTIPVSPEGIDALLDIYPVFEAFQLRYVSKGLLMDAEKTSLRPCRMGVQRGRELLQSLRRSVPRLPAPNQPASDAGRLAGLGFGAAHGRATAGCPGRGAWLGPWCSNGPRIGAGGQSSGGRRNPACSGSGGSKRPQQSNQDGRRTWLKNEFLSA